MKAEAKSELNTISRKNAAIFRKSLMEDHDPAEVMAAAGEDPSPNYYGGGMGGMSHYSGRSRAPETEFDQIKKLYEAIDEKIRG